MANQYRSRQPKSACMCVQMREVKNKQYSACHLELHSEHKYKEVKELSQSKLLQENILPAYSHNHSCQDHRASNLISTRSVWSQYRDKLLRFK